MPSTRSRLVSLGVALALVAAAFVASWGLVSALDLPTGPDDYNLARWEVRYFPSKWLFQVGSLFRSRPNGSGEKNRVVERYLTLNAEIAKLEDEGAPPASRGLDEKRRERQSLENTVEWILEGRVTAVAEQLGLEISWPLLPIRWVFPPVDFEFAEPPHVLAISPRDRVELESSTLLRSDLTPEETAALEARREAQGVSALVVGVGGVGTYPSAVPPGADYRETLETVAHEWLHHYFFFKPLGQRYFSSTTLKTLNETVADIAGREMGQLVAERFPLSRGFAIPPSPRPTPDQAVDFNAVMRQLRRDVDRLLGEGQVDEAEALMESRRRFLVEHGFRIRRINQAYFAFHGLYADTPASISPIGPKLQELRRRLPSLSEFIRVAAQLTSEQDLDRLLTPGP